MTFFLDLGLQCCLGGGKPWLQCWDCGDIQLLQQTEQFAKGGPKLFAPWMALQDQKLARED